MTIGKSSKKQKPPRSPPFLDQAGGFYGRLDETETDCRTEAQVTEKQSPTKPVEQETDSVALPEDFSEAMMEDDGTTLLKRKPSRLSRRWSRKSSKRTKSDKPSLEIDKNTESQAALCVVPSLGVHLVSEPETGSGNGAPEPTIIHFSITEEADDQKLIPDDKEKEKDMKGNKKGDMEDSTGTENIKVAKKNSFRNYRKVLDKALRRGWETFVANLYSVTLSPGSSSMSSPSKAEMDRKTALAEFRL